MNGSVYLYKIFSNFSKCRENCSKCQKNHLILISHRQNSVEYLKNCSKQRENCSKCKKKGLNFQEKRRKCENIEEFTRNISKIL